MTLAELRRVARSEGRTRFFTGEPCVHGHVAERQVGSGQCVECHRHACRDAYAKNPDRIKQNAKSWRANNREKKNQMGRDWAKKNPQKANARAKSWRQRNPEKAKAIADRYKKRHPERVAAWKSSNVDKIRNYTRNRRRRLDGAGGSHTVDDVLTILKAQRRRCAYCRKKLGSDYHVDHVMAVTRGGSNDRRNLQVLCPPCNHKKFNHDPVDFAQSLGRLL